MKGRKPKPVDLRLLAGNAGHRPIEPAAASGGHEDESQPFVRGELVKPKGLSRDQSREWDRLTTTLRLILSRGSEGMVLVACGYYADMCEAERIIKKEGRFYTTKNKQGQTMKRAHPALQSLTTARAGYQRALAELGASPVAHSRVRTLPGGEQQTLPGMGRHLA